MHSLCLEGAPLTPAGAARTMLSVVAAPATAVRAFAAATLGRTISTAGARPAVAVVAVVAPPGVTPVVPAAVVPGCSCRRVGAVSRPQWAEAWLCARTVVAPLHLLRRGRTQRCSAGSATGRGAQGVLRERHIGGSAPPATRLASAPRCAPLRVFVVARQGSGR